MSSIHVEIRPLVEADAYTSVKWRNIPDIWTQTEFAPPREITINDEMNWIRRAIVVETARRFAILAEGEYVGNIYLTGIVDGVADYHIFIGELRYWGKGVAKSASLKLIRFASEVLELDRIHLKVRRDNQAAVRLYTNLGFKLSGSEGDFLLMDMELGEGR